MVPRVLFGSALLVSFALACVPAPSTLSPTGIVCRLTKPAALVLNEQTAQVIQMSFRHAEYPDIKGEKSMKFFGKVTYGLTNIHVDNLSIGNSEVDFKEDVATEIDIQNVSASFRGTLSYGYVGNWWMKLIHSIDFEIESAIDLQIAIKLGCENERIIADISDCYLTFHKLNLHLQGDKDPGWIKQLFTNFISFTLKLVLKTQVCKEIVFLSNMLAGYVQDFAANFLHDGDIAVDVSMSAHPAVKANYIESHHKGRLLYKNLSGIVPEPEFIPSLLTESRMIYFWFSEQVLSSLVLAMFLDKRLELTITGEELKEMLENEKLKTHQAAIQEIFQHVAYNNSMAQVWSLNAPQVTLRPEGTLVEALVAVQLSVMLQGEPSTVLYFEEDLTLTIQASYAEKKLGLHLTHARIAPGMIKHYPNMAKDPDTLRHVLEEIIYIVGIPKVISKIEPALTDLMDSKGLNLFEIRDAEIITRQGYFIAQMDFSFPHHLLVDFLKRNLEGSPQEDESNDNL